ncbi:MAG: 6-bladed beta-propeller [Candidatus Cloacimonetes bacterium]|nr:6-bladed beta-propeller [Candidatus Cloacimonadota bacterium]
MDREELKQQTNKRSKMKKNLFIAIAFILLLGCSSQKENFKKEVIDGITFIYNSDIEFSEITLESELIIDLDEIDEDEHFFKSLNFVTENNEGEIFITDNSKDEISVFSYDGKYKKSFGSNGKGPGEFDDIGNIAFFQNGDMIVSDIGNYRYQVLDKNGNFLYSNKENNIPIEVIVDNKDCIITSPSMFGIPIEKGSPLISIYDRKFDLIKNIDEMEAKDALSYGFFQGYYQIAKKSGNDVVVSSFIDNWIKIYKRNKLITQIDRVLPYKTKPLKSRILKKGHHFVDYQSISMDVSVDSEGILIKKIPLYEIKVTNFYIGKDNKIYLYDRYDRDKLAVIRYKAVL